MTGRLDDRVAIITGAASGIGAATAQLFAREGARVVAADIDQRGVDICVQSIRDTGGIALSAYCDVRDEQSIAHMVGRAVDQFNRLDVLFANAGISRRMDLRDTRVRDFDEIVAVNLRGPFLCAKHAIPLIVDQGGGSVIFTASELALVGSERGAVYSASKTGLLGLTRSLALDFALDGVRVNAVCPGATDTPLLWNERDIDRATRERMIAQAMPLGRVGQPRDIASAALFLASDDSSFMTGQALVVDGGVTIR